MMISPMPLVVGICGQKFHGKDTAASVLINEFGFKKVAFADGLKQVVADVLRIDVAILHDPSRKEEIHEPSGKTYREWLQVAGTEWFRSMWADVWVNWWRVEIESKGYSRVVAPDMRFWNEFDALRTNPNWLTMTARVFNPRIAPSGDTHESERYAMQFPVNAELINDGDISAIQEKMRNAACSFLL